MSAQRTPPWLLAHRKNNAEALAATMALCAVIIVVITLVLTSYMSWLEPATMGPRTAFGILIIGGCIALRETRNTAFVRRRVVPIVLGFVMALITVTVAYWQVVAPQAADSATTVFIVISMGTALLFPWGMRAQAVVCIAVLVGYAALAWTIPRVFHPLAGGMLVATTPLVLLAARLLERYRSHLFERSWKQDRFLALAHTLGTPLEPQQVAAAVLECGAELLEADGGSVSLRTTDRNAYRVVAVQGPNSEAWLGCEVPDDFGMAAQVAERKVLVLPDDDPANPFLTVLAQEGMSQALYAAVVDGEEIVGVLSFSRRDMRPFLDTDRTLARALGNHAALALRTARVITDLQEASRLKSEFVSTVSHELRTPLNIIMGYVEMGRDATLSETERLDCLEHIDVASRELLKLIESTLEIGKLEAGRGETRLEPVAFETFWHELGAECLRFPRRPGVLLEWRELSGPLTVSTDPRKLSMVVRNLVSNAFKFTERGWVLATVDVESQFVRIRVSDSGIGIGPEDRETIFEMFRQVDGSDKRSYGGVGLGLYLVRRFVEQLGGTVSFESERGTGTAFTVHLPYGAALATPSRDAA